MSELAAHQREAVTGVLALLARFGGALLADEVGLGKSFVAAAVAAELQRGGTAVDLVVPKSLLPQWRATLEDFGVEAALFTHDGLARVPFVADADRERLIIVDEAHAFRNRATRRWAALAQRSVAARLLFVTATPVCNSLDDLGSLVALMAPDDALRPCGVHSIEAAFRERDRLGVAAVATTFVIRRERDVLPPELRFGVLAKDVVRHSVPAAAIDELQFPLVGEAALLRRFLWRRLESSEEALIESVDRQLRFYDRAGEALQRGRTLTKPEYRRAFGDDDSLQQVLFWEVFTPPAVAGDTAAIAEEVGRLERLRQAAQATPRTKLQRLAALRADLDAPAVIFTAHHATAAAIHATLGGGLGRDGIGAFLRGRVDTLVVTDFAAEGLNLQRAGAIVHYDLPWNPVKLDQRNGRAYRIGQKRNEVRAIYFVPEEDRTHVLETVAGKNVMRKTALRPGSQALSPFPFALPQYIPRDCSEASLIRALDRRQLAVPPILLRRYRAGPEQLMGEMAHEYLDAGRLAELAALLAREREIAHI
jgi:superfamily II DNA or RNA helicase